MLQPRFFFAQVDDVLEHPSPEGSLQDESSNGSAMRRSLCGSHDKSLVARTFATQLATSMQETASQDGF